MKPLIQKIVITILLMIITSPNANSAWSKFTDVNSMNETKYDIQVKVVTKQNKQHIYQIKAPMVGKNKHCWLIVCKNKLKPKQRNFREYIWNKESKRSDILLKVPLTPTKAGDIKLTIHKDLVSKSYIYIDFPHMVWDGGYYYAIDLASYVKEGKKTNIKRNSEKNPFRDRSKFTQKRGRKTTWENEGY